MGGTYSSSGSGSESTYHVGSAGMRVRRGSVIVALGKEGREGPRAARWGAFICECVKRGTANWLALLKLNVWAWVRHGADRTRARGFVGLLWSCCGIQRSALPSVP